MSTRGAERERHADLIRVGAIWVVVLGHWLVLAVTEVDGTLDGVNALGVLTWAHPLTWVFQVMPLFFVVGGFANASSMQRHRARGGDAVGWLGARFRRLLLPAAALLGTLVVTVPLATAAGVDPELAGDAAWVATIPLWFLAVYLVVVALAPLSHRLHRRWGLAVPVAGAVVVAGVDGVRLATGGFPLADVNYAAAWLTIHQLGYFWHDRRPSPGPGPGAWLAGGGALSLVVLVVAGPYPVSMVTVPGQELQNTEPPTLALLALAVTQFGLALLLRGPASRWLRDARRWALVSRVQSVVFTVFLWHMAAAVIAAAAVYGGGLIAPEPIGTAPWIVLRLPWVAASAVMLAVLVAVFARIEGSARSSAWTGPVHGPLLAAAIVLGGVAATAGMLGIAVAGSGSHGPLGLPTAAAVSGIAGAAVVGLSTARRPASRQT